MSTKIDQSLDEIMANTGAARQRGNRNRRRGGARKPTTPAAPVGGIAKSTRAAKSAVKATPTGPAAQRDSKIVVSNLVRHSRLCAPSAPSSSDTTSANTT